MKLKNKHSKLTAPIALALAFTFFAGGCGSGGGVALRPDNETIKADAPGKGPHVAASVATLKTPVASSGWLELFLDDASKTVSIRSHSDAEWSTLPRTPATVQSNQGACAVEADIYVNGSKITLNSQDHAVAYGNAVVTKNIKDKTGEGVEIAYTLTPDAATAARAAGDAKKLKQDDVAFKLRVRYTLLDGNFWVHADWQNLSKNPKAFIAEIGLMERFGALRSPGPNDFILLPDGCGALLYPANKSSAADKDLRFAVYGEDPSNPGRTDDTPLRAAIASFGVRGQSAGFIALVEQGAAQCEIIAKQNIPGEIKQSAAGVRFKVTAVGLDKAGAAAYRAPNGYFEGDPAGLNKSNAMSIVYRFFNKDNAVFSTMAVACRELLINTGVLSSTKTVQNNDSLLPLNLTLLGTGPGAKGANRKLTTFAQAQDIIMRLKNSSINNINVRYLGALRNGWLQSSPERVAPLARLGGKTRLAELQSYCETKGVLLYLDTQLYPASTQTAKSISGKVTTATHPNTVLETDKTVKLRSLSSLNKATHALLTRLGEFNAAGISLADVGTTLYSDYSGKGMSRMQAIDKLDTLLPALSAKWKIMLNGSNIYAARYADVIVNLPSEPQMRMAESRYIAVPLMQMLLHGSADYSGKPLNLSKDDPNALLRAISFGACPSYVWQSAVDDPTLSFESENTLTNAANAYSKLNSALADLRKVRIVEYRIDAMTGICITRYSNETMIYVNYSDTTRVLDNMTIPAKNFIRTEG